jgi:hypothetical protein
MEKYLGVKMIQATPMNRLDYNKYRGWELPADENGTDLCLKAADNTIVNGWLPSQTDMLATDWRILD